MTQIASTQITRRASTAPRRSVLSRLDGMFQTLRQRRQLARLDADALKDIGIDARAAHEEASRPIWDAPASWKS